MKRKAYVERYDGVYTYSWAVGKGYVFELGLSESDIGSPALMRNQLLLGSVTHNNRLHGWKSMRVDLDVDTISVPTYLYEHVKAVLDHLAFSAVEDDSGHAGFSGPCSNIDRLAIKYPSGLKELTFTLAIFGVEPFTIDPTTYFFKNGEVCTLLITPSNEDVLVLGTPVLKVCSVNILKNSGALSYSFHSREKPGFLDNFRIFK